MPRYASKTDANQKAIVEVLRKRGFYVRIQSGVGEDWPDLFVSKADTGPFLAEVKDGAKVPSAQKLTPGQASLHSQLGQFGVKVVVLRSVSDALEL